MFAKIRTVSFIGLEVKEIEVQVHITRGIPSFAIVGLANKSVSEAKERVRSAIISAGFSFPQNRITVNLAPADIIKDGSHYDLPIAIGILTSIGVIAQKAIEGQIIMGELSLDGNLHHVCGLLPASVYASKYNLGIITAFDSAGEALFVEDISVISAKSLLNLIDILQGSEQAELPHKIEIGRTNKYIGDFCDVKGQQHAKRALEIAASGGHNILMKGMPGSGKSMLAQRIISIMPQLNFDEMLEVGIINSIAFPQKKFVLSADTPFRSPHHSASTASIVGGGKKAKPGEITLAHKGILFLDEFAEFATNVLESLRQPMESHEIAISRAEHHVTYPADFQLIAAMNPCKCGYLGDAKKECSRAPSCAKEYQKKISGPLMERIDIHITVNPNTANIFGEENIEVEKSAVIQKRVLSARNIQEYRFGKRKTNAQMTVGEVEVFCTLDDECAKIIQSATTRFGLSMRQYHKILKISRTIADLANSKHVLKPHLLEALGFRE